MAQSLVSFVSSSPLSNFLFSSSSPLLSFFFHQVSLPFSNIHPFIDNLFFHDWNHKKKLNENELNRWTYYYSNRIQRPAYTQIPTRSLQLWIRNATSRQKCHIQGLFLAAWPAVLPFNKKCLAFGDILSLFVVLAYISRGLEATDFMVGATENPTKTADRWQV